MERIKSAYEIALERAAKLGKVSAEELEEIKEREYAPVGQGIADRYLQGGWELRDLKIAIDKYKGERDRVVRAALSRLVCSISLEDYQRAVEGVKLLAEDKESLNRACQQMASLAQEYQQAKQQKYRESEEAIAQSVKGELERLGISGSAVDIDAESTKQWQELAGQVRARFEEKLDKIRRGLLTLGVRS